MKSLYKKQLEPQSTAVILYPCTTAFWLAVLKRSCQTHNYRCKWESSPRHSRNLNLCFNHRAIARHIVPQGVVLREYWYVFLREIVKHFLFFLFIYLFFLWLVHKLLFRFFFCSFSKPLSECFAKAERYRPKWEMKNEIILFGNNFFHINSKFSWFLDKCQNHFA